MFLFLGIVSHLQENVSTDKLSAGRVNQVSTTICKLQEYVKAIKRLELDDQEFAYLKTIALFGAGNNKDHFYYYIDIIY